MPFATFTEVPLTELGAALAKNISVETLAEQVSDFEANEAQMLLTALFLYFADEREHPGRPVSLAAYSPFFPVEGIDQP